MSYTLLEIVRAASREMGLPSPNGVASAQDDRTQQLFYLVNALGKDLVTANEWQRLVTEYTFTTDGTDDYDLPSDFDRPSNRTQWDRSTNWAMRGPVTAESWQFLQSSGLANGYPTIRWRIVGNEFRVFPTPASSLTYAYEYISNKWALSSTGVAQSAFAADTDTCIYRDRLMVAGLKMMFYQAKGLDSTRFEHDYAVALEQAIGQESGAPTLSLNGGGGNRFRLLDDFNLPDTGYG